MKIPAGEVELELEATPPARRGAPISILSHPHPRMGGTMHNKVVDQLFRRSAERGWGAVRFNFRGVSGSTGTFEKGAGETDDLRSVMNWTRNEFGVELRDLTLVGYSFGAWVSSKVAAALTELRQLILIAPPITILDFSMVLNLRHRKQIFAAERDEFVNRTPFEEWYAQVLPPKSVQIIEGADHFFVSKTTELIRKVLRVIDPE